MSDETVRSLLLGAALGYFAGNLLLFLLGYALSRRKR